MKKISHYLIILLGMAGYVPHHATLARTISILFSILSSYTLAYYYPLAANVAIAYFILAAICYFTFINLVLSKNGLRHWYITSWGSEHEGYLAYEATLSILFFHNATSIGYVASSAPGALAQALDLPPLFFFALSVFAILMFILGFLIKIWAAEKLTIDIYYFKDMFLGRQVSVFKKEGPYKFLANPMYGIGQLPAYAVALWYGSINGLVAAFINQALIYLFYFFTEKPFIQRIYREKLAKTV